MSRLRRSNSLTNVTGNASFTPKVAVPLVYLDTDLVGNVRRPRVAVNFATLVRLVNQFVVTYPQFSTYVGLSPLLQVLPSGVGVGFNPSKSFFVKNESGIYQLFCRQREYDLGGLRAAISEMSAAFPSDADSRKFEAFKLTNGAFEKNNFGTRKSRTRNRNASGANGANNGNNMSQQFRQQAIE